MAISAYSLLSLSDIKDRLQIAGTTDDDVLESMAGGMTSAIEHIVGQVVQRAPRTDFVDGGDRHFVYGFPDMLGPGGITQVREWNGSGWDTLVSGTDYFLEPWRTATASHSGWIRRTDANRNVREWVSGIRTVEVTWTPGRYATTGAVGDLFKEAMATCCRNWWRQYQNSVSVGLGGGEFTEPRVNWPKFAVPPPVVELLMPETPWPVIL